MTNDIGHSDASGILTGQSASRQSELNLFIPESVVIVGCGGIGFWLTLEICSLGMNHLRRLVLIDGDQVDISNLERAFYPEDSIGFNKADVLADIVNDYRPGRHIVIPVPHMCTIDMIDELVFTGDVVFDCTDDFTFQQNLYQKCKQIGIRYIRIGCTADYYMVTDTVSAFDTRTASELTTDTSSREQCGVVVPSWVVPPILATGRALLKLCRRPDLNETININES